MKKYYKASCEFYLKASDIEKVKNYIKEECGIDFFEAHMFVGDITFMNDKKPINIDVELD